MTMLWVSAPGGAPNFQSHCGSMAVMAPPETNPAAGWCVMSPPMAIERGTEPGSDSLSIDWAGETENVRT